MKIKVLIILCTICYIFTVASIVIADSGFDFSYDSGSSSWDSSSSSWDYDNYSSGCLFNWLNSQVHVKLQVYDM